MKPRSQLGLFVLFLSASLLVASPSIVNIPMVNASAPASLGVWNDEYGSNITSLTGLAPGTTFTAKVNVTGAGQLGGFDVTLGFFMVIGPRVLKVNSASFSGSSPGQGLFDNTGLPTGCSVIQDKHDFSNVLGTVRFRAFLQGSVMGTGQECTVPGDGTLFFITFQVLIAGSTTFDIIQYSIQGKPISLIIGPAPAVLTIPYQRFNGYFRNIAGIPPVPQVTYSPSAPIQGGIITFNGSQSYDPGAQGLPNHGLETEPIVYDSNVDLKYDSSDTVIVGSPVIGDSLCCIVFRADKHITYVDLTNAGHWDQGDPVVYDSNLDMKYDTIDFVVSGPLVANSTALKLDPSLVFDPIHGKFFWDDGYIWDFGDGLSQVTGSTTSRLFLFSTSQPAVGTFEVKLAVYDSDDHLPMRTIQFVSIFPAPPSPPLHDVSVQIFIFDMAGHDQNSFVVGDSVRIQVTLSNHGLQTETVNLTLSRSQGSTFCTCQEGIALARESRINLAFRANLSLSYTLETSDLPVGPYTLSAKADVLDPVTGGVINPSNPFGNLVWKFFAIVAARISATTFFTDSSSKLLPLDARGFPVVQVVMPNGIVRSTNPSQILKWTNVTNMRGEPLDSIQMMDMLPMNWSIPLGKAQIMSAIHVYFVSSSERLDITNGTLINSKPVPEGIVLSLSLVNLRNTIAGEPLQPGESILVSVKLQDQLRGTVLGLKSFSGFWAFGTLVHAWTQKSFSGSSVIAYATGVLDAQAKLRGDPNRSFNPNMSPIAIAMASFGTIPDNSAWNAMAYVGLEDKVGLDNLSVRTPSGHNTRVEGFSSIVK